MMSVNETACVATVHVQISPPFFGWMAQFGNRMRVLSPDSAAKNIQSTPETSLRIQSYNMEGNSNGN